MISAEVLNGKRKHELILLDQLLNHVTITPEKYNEALQEAGCLVDENTLKSVQRIFNLSFFTQTDQKKYGEKPIVELQSDEYYTFNEGLKESLEQKPFFKKLMKDVVMSGLERSKKYNSDIKLTRYEKYTRKDACKLLNWKNDESATMYGYKTKHQTCPIFVTYHKNDEVEASINYGDEFISEEILKWESKNNRKISSKEIQKIIYAEERGIDLHLFVKKSDDEDGSDFYYLGQTLPDKDTVTQDSMPNNSGKMVPVVHMNMVLDKPVEHQLYNYIVQNVD